jgi:hypothetical protein
MKRSFEKKIYDPFARIGGAAQVEHSVRHYPDLYAPRPMTGSAIDVLDGRFLSAWEAEFGISLDAIGNFVAQLEELGVERKEAILSVSRATMISMLATSGGCSAERASDTLALLVLESRPHWRVAPEGFKNRDWEPWRFGRRLSVLRRPFLQIEGGENAEIVFAPGLVREALFATIR